MTVVRRRAIEARIDAAHRKLVVAMHDLRAIDQFEIAQLVSNAAIRLLSALRRLQKETDVLRDPRGRR